jgi:hypothetical protein
MLVRITLWAFPFTHNLQVDAVFLQAVTSIAYTIRPGGTLGLARGAIDTRPPFDADGRRLLFLRHHGVPNPGAKIRNKIHIESLSSHMTYTIAQQF